MGKVELFFYYYYFLIYANLLGDHLSDKHPTIMLDFTNQTFVSEFKSFDAKGVNLL